MALKFGLNDWQQYQPRNDEDAPIVLCFGDSWFWYPIPGVGNLSNRFLDFGRRNAFDVAALGKNGMEIAYPGKDILSDLTTFLQWESKTVDMIAVSGGGNDFAGADDLDPLLGTRCCRRPDRSPAGAGRGAASPPAFVGLRARSGRPAI